MLAQLELGAVGARAAEHEIAAHGARRATAQRQAEADARAEIAASAAALVKRRRRVAGAMPGPWSRTVIRAVDSRTVAISSILLSAEASFDPHVLGQHIAAATNREQHARRCRVIAQLLA